MDTFSFQIPNGYLVERVIGENIRSWDVRPAENWQQLVVNALSAARNRETMTVHLSKRDFQIPEDAVKLEAPYLSVEGAALQKGSYVIRRSPVIEVSSWKHKLQIESIKNSTRPGLIWLPSPAIPAR